MRLILIFSLLLTAGNSFSQAVDNRSKVLILKEAGKNKILIFRTTDPIRLKLKDRDNFIKGRILEFRGDSTIVLDRGEVEFLDIDRIDIRGKKSSMLGPKIALAGIGYLLLDIVNPGGSRGRDIKVYRVSGPLVAGGILVHLLRRKYFKVGGRRYLQFQIR